jgi:hypothetical protein
MKKQSRLIIALFFGIGIIAGCSKKNDKPAVILTRTNLVGTYQFTDETAKQGSAATVDLFLSADACQKDDLVEFKADSSVNFIDAGMVCSPAHNSTVDWDLPNSSTLIVSGDSYKVKSFDGKTLMITFSDYSTTPPVVYTITLIKK